jgi:hypothetical protein
VFGKTTESEFGHPEQSFETPPASLVFGKTLWCLEKLLNQSLDTRKRVLKHHLFGVWKDFQAL